MQPPKIDWRKRGRRVRRWSIPAGAFALGLAVGARTCVEQMPLPPPEVVIAPCDCPTPQARLPAPTPTSAGPRPAPRGLPPAPPPDPEGHRQKLLTWVRSHSSELGACRGTGKTQTRLAVTITLAQGRDPQTVVVSAAPGEVSAETRSCVRARVAAWQLPAELTQGRRELIFGLTL